MSTSESQSTHGESQSGSFARESETEWKPCSRRGGQEQRPGAAGSHEPAQGSCETSGKVHWLQAGVSPGGPALLTRERHTLMAASLPQSLYGAIEPRAAQSRKVLTVSFYFVLNKR